MDESIEKTISLMKTESESPCADLRPFVELGFKDARKACELLKDSIRKGRVHEEGLQKFSRCLNEIALSCDPDMTLLNLVRFLDTSSTHRHIFNSICIEEPIFRILSVLFSASNFLTSVFIRNPGLILWLIERETLGAEKSLDRYIEELRSKASLFSDTRRKINAVKRYRSREVLRIALRDLMGLADLEETTAELSRLTDAVIDTVAEISFVEVSRESGIEGIEWERRSAKPYANFAVISLGKLGGNELNYSSDIDLLYVASPSGEPKEYDFYTSLAKRITSHLSSPTEEGVMYRVDLRLRPDGESGPLVVKTSEHLNYMMQRAQDWERQSLIKVRFSAGNGAAASEFIENCKNVVFDPLGKGDPLPHILAMRQKALSLLDPAGRERNIKEMPGGIRDIEFIVQSFQLSFGRRIKEIRSGNTLEALEALSRFGLMTKKEAVVLERCYRLYRIIEHRLQLLNNARTHMIPVEDRDLDILAKRVALSKLPSDVSENFKTELSSCLQTVSELFDTHFKGSEPDLTYFVFSADRGLAKSTGNLLNEHIKKVGPSVIPFIKSIAFGDFPKLESRSTRESAKRNLPVILDAAARTPDAATTMKNLTRIIKATGATKTMLDIIASDDDMLRLLTTIASNSTILSSWLAGNIGWLDSLTEGLYEENDIEGSEKRIGDACKQKLLFTLCRLPIPDFGPGEIGPPLCEILKSFVTSLFRMHGGEGSKLAILSMGSLAVGDCKFGRDVDIIAVTSNEIPTQAEIETIRNMIASSERIGIARIDLRLRPEGEASPIVKTLGRFRDYFANRAATWEILAYTKCNYLCGNIETAKRFEELLEGWLEGISVDSVLAEKILEERKKLETLSKGDWETKFARGGTYDIDYIIASSMLLETGLKRRSANTLQAIDRLEASGLLSKEEAERLKEAFSTYYLINHAANLHGFALPPSKSKEPFYLEYFGRLLSPRFAVGRSVKDRLGSLRKDVRTIFSKFFEALE